DLKSVTADHGCAYRSSTSATFAASGMSRRSSFLQPLQTCMQPPRLDGFWPTMAEISAGARSAGPFDCFELAVVCAEVYRSCRFPTYQSLISEPAVQANPIPRQADR